MDWECRFTRKANQRLRSIPRGVAGIITNRVEELSKMKDPSQGSDFIEDMDDEKLNNPAYSIEIHAHFIKFELLQDENRKILKILDIE